MARYKEYCYEQTKLIPISFHHQILPGTFEYTLNYLIDNEVDLSLFEQRYRNDDTGAPAYDPAVLLKRRKGVGSTLVQNRLQKILRLGVR